MKFILLPIVSAITLLCVALAGEAGNPIKAFGEKWRAAYQAGDLEALTDLYEPDAWLMTRRQPAKKSRDEVIAYFAAVKARGAKASIDFEYEDITIDGDYAFAISTWRLTVESPDGKPPFRDAGRSFLVFKRGEDDQWRVWRDMDNHTPDAPIEGKT